MSRLIFADPHWSDNPRDRYRHDFVDWLITQIKKRQTQQVILLGDLTVEKNFHEAWLVNRCVDHIYRLAQEVMVGILMANHDYTNPNHPFFEFLSRIPGVTWISNPTRNGNVLFLPHTTRWKMDWADGLIEEPSDIVFAHQTFQGATVGGRPLEGGIPLDIFHQKRVISGDIHTPQKVPMPNGGTLTYVGAPYRINFGDDYEPRILQLDDNDKLTSITVPGVRKILLDVAETSGVILPDLLNTAAGQQQTEHGDILKVRMAIDRDSYDDWHRIKSHIRAWGEGHGYVIDSIHPVLEKAARTVTRREDHRNDETLVRAYGKKVAASPDILEAGLKLLEST